MDFAQRESMLKIQVDGVTIFAKVQRADCAFRAIVVNLRREVG